jgi:hypothetical protein
MTDLETRAVLVVLAQMLKSQTVYVRGLHNSMVALYEVLTRLSLLVRSQHYLFRRTVPSRISPFRDRVDLQFAQFERIVIKPAKARTIEPTQIDIVRGIRGNVRAVTVGDGADDVPDMAFRALNAGAKAKGHVTP